MTLKQLIIKLFGITQTNLILGSRPPYLVIIQLPYLKFQFVQSYNLISLIIFQIHNFPTSYKVSSTLSRWLGQVDLLNFMNQKCMKFPSVIISFNKGVLKRCAIQNCYRSLNGGKYFYARFQRALHFRITNAQDLTATCLHCFQLVNILSQILFPNFISLTIISGTIYILKYTVFVLIKTTTKAPSKCIAQAILGQT